MSTNHMLTGLQGLNNRSNSFIGLRYLKGACIAQNRPTLNHTRIRLQFHVGYQTHYLILAKTYHSEGERKRATRKMLKLLHFCSGFPSLPQFGLATLKTPDISHWSSRWCVDSHANLGSLRQSSRAYIFFCLNICY